MKLKVGDKVKLNKYIKSFTYGDGGVCYDEIGTIEYKGYGDVCVVFPSHSNWHGKEYELVLVKEDKFFKKLPNNFTGTLEIKNGYIVEKEYLSNVIKPCRHKIEYIIKTGSYSEEYISISLPHEDVDLPCFEKGTMYKGMEANKEYTLEELGL